MDDIQVGTSYPFAQMAKALVTAGTHRDPKTRKAAESKVDKWRAVIAGMAGNLIDIGSRTPVEGMPAWVTPEVVHGGFATGRPMAGGPLQPHEVALAERLGLLDEGEPDVAGVRVALFDHHLTATGIAELSALLDAGTYHVAVPEEAALPVAVWLLRSGDETAAVRLVETIAPWSDRLRFAPAPTPAGAAPDPAPGSDIVFRTTAGQARETLLARGANDRIEAEREALTVWNPFADELLSLWLETVADGRIGAAYPEGWRDRAAGKLEDYRALAERYTRCTKHRKSRSNLAILRTALAAVLQGDPVEMRLLRRAVDGMLASRGRPGSGMHAALRARQATVAAAPTHHMLAQAAAERLADLPPDDGIADPDRLLGSAMGRELPVAVVRIVGRAAAGTPEHLVDRGVIGSAEVLATLTPQLTAGVVAGAYPDPTLRRLMAANYRAFRGRRSLLLLNLEHQVRVEELPWVLAVRSRRADRAEREAARATLGRLAALTVRGFPATALPNPMIRELSTLSKAAGLRLPWTEELAADIFMGTFSDKFPLAAGQAGELLAGTLYARYYGIDYAALARVEDFGELCRQRSGQPVERYRRPAVNGTIIEQAQILTTHNLATLVSLGDLGTGHLELARRCLDTTRTLVGRLEGNRRPLSTVKDAAYAWRQMLVHLALVSTEAQASFVAQARGSAPRRLAPALDGLAEVLQGRTARPFLGWTTQRHWILDA
jgi:hypothetical protein